MVEMVVVGMGNVEFLVNYVTLPVVVVDSARGPVVAVPP